MPTGKPHGPGRAAKFREFCVAEEVLIDEGCFIVESWNQVTDPAVSIARARVAARTATRNHCLDIDERYLVVSGSASVEIGGEHWVAHPGDVIYVPAGCPQRVLNDSDEDFIFYCVCNPRFSVEHYHDLETLA